MTLLTMRVKIFLWLQNQQKKLCRPKMHLYYIEHYSNKVKSLVTGRKAKECKDEAQPCQKGLEDTGGYQAEHEPAACSDSPVKPTVS